MDSNNNQRRGVQQNGYLLLDGQVAEQRAGTATPVPAEDHPRERLQALSAWEVEDRIDGLTQYRSGGRHRKDHCRHIATIEWTDPADCMHCFISKNW